MGCLQEVQALHGFCDAILEELKSSKSGLLNQNEDV